MNRIYLGVYNVGNFLKDFLLLAMRLYWGWNFFMAGLGKFGDIAMVTEYFDSLQIPLPFYQAYLVATIELVGGLCLILGLAARIAAIPLAITMIVALFTAHLAESSQIFENPQRFINQIPFNFLLTSLIVFCFGPGKFSIDAWVFPEPYHKKSY